MVVSPRALKFGKNQISWACHEYEASEVWPEPRDRLDQYHQAKRLLMAGVLEGDKFKMCGHAPDERCGAHASATNIWNNFVQTYS
jgi:hypothetical protein